MVPAVFGLGMMEIGLIIALAVMLFPPSELPKLARSIARVYGQVRKTADDFRNAVLQDEDLRQPIDEIKGVYEEARGEIRDAERKARQQLAKAQMDLRMATARRIQAERETKATQAALVSAGGEPRLQPALGGNEASEASPAAEESTGGAVVAAFPGLASDHEEDEGGSDGEATVASTDPRTLNRPRAVAANGPADSAD
jgi:Sec-independent protein translocase protein TatA